jgi:thiol:disulfide interchange protein
MPCVFPVLFLKALSLAGSATEDRRTQRLHGFSYTAGILVSFWTIVAVLLVLRARGRQAGWGFQLQPLSFFVVLMASLLFFLALSHAGQFDFGLNLTSKGDALTRKPGYTGSFFTGVVATVVAKPCTAPLMGAAIGFPLAQSAVVIRRAQRSQTTSNLTLLSPSSNPCLSTVSRGVSYDVQHFSFVAFWIACHCRALEFTSP